MAITDYQGPARTFSKGDEHFDLMLARGVDFLAYFVFWSTGGDFDVTKLDQQDCLGIARAMAIAMEKNDHEKDLSCPR